MSKKGGDSDTDTESNKPPNLNTKRKDVDMLSTADGKGTIQLDKETRGVRSSSKDVPEESGVSGGVDRFAEEKGVQIFASWSLVPFIYLIPFSLTLRNEERLNEASCYLCFKR